MAKKPEESPTPERKKPELEPTFPPDVLPDPEVTPQPPEIQPITTPEISPLDSPEISW
jgi:hypothetical protein